MKDLRRARQVGICSILLAVCLRLWAAGLPEWVLFRQMEPNTALISDSETGRTVRFSSSSEVFIPDFVESPPPLLPQPRETPLPSFSGEETVEIYNPARKEPDIPQLLAKPLQWNLFGEDPTVLILHTHTTESYTQLDEPYVETSRWRTLDEHYNMLSIGQHLGQLLAESGITAVQDRTVHDYPSYNGSYAHARKSIQEYLEKYPTIQLVLDLHRDASGTEGAQMRTLAQVNGESSAQLMVVLGTNQEDYEENLSLGLKLHAQLERQAGGIMRPLQLRTSRFNQDLCTGALLIEVGAAGNSHAEALLAAEELAKAITALAKGTQ